MIGVHMPAPSKP